MKELLDKINKMFDDSIETGSEEVAVELKILKGNINTLFKEAMKDDIENVETLEIRSKNDSNKKKILIADDSSLIRNYIEKICSPKNKVLMANDGQETIDILEAEDVSLLLLDLMMPHVDGFAVLEYLKEKNSDIPVIIISGDTTKDTIDRAFTYNVIDMIEKPFPEKALLEKIERILE